MYEVSRVNVKVERGATLTFKHDLSYVAVFYARKSYVRIQEKLDVEIHLNACCLVTSSSRQ